MRFALEPPKVEHQVIDVTPEKQKENADANEKLDKPKKDSLKVKDNKGLEDDKNREYSEEDEFNLSLAAMENEIKPKVISSIDILCKNYTKLIKFQNEKLNCALHAKQFSRPKEKNYKKIQNYIIEKIETLQLNSSVLEDLVQLHYQENKKIISLEGILMRSAMENKISRDEFLKYYLGNEINPNFESFLN